MSIDLNMNGALWLSASHCLSQAIIDWRNGDIRDGQYKYEDLRHREVLTANQKIARRLGAELGFVVSAVVALAEAVARLALGLLFSPLIYYSGPLSDSRSFGYALYVVTIGGAVFSGVTAITSIVSLAENVYRDRINPDDYIPSRLSSIRLFS